MKEKDIEESRHKLTDDTHTGHTHNQVPQGVALSKIDPRIVELVRFLARTAAEKDYAELLAKTRPDTGREKETLQ